MKRFGPGVLVVLACFALTEYFWIRHQSISALCAIYALGLAALVFLFRSREGEAWPAPPAEERLPSAPPRRPFSRFQALSLGLGLAGLGAALFLALKDKLAWSLIPLILSALALRPSLDTRPQAMDWRWQAALLLLVLAVGSLFRLYKAGEIPQGMITVDEPRLYEYVREIHEGKREWYNTRAGEGNLPLYLAALTQNIFGRDITGFRLAGIFCGILMVGLMAMLGREIAGARLGLLAAAFTAMAFWPVSFCRAEYLIAAAYLPILATPWLFLAGLRRGLPWVLVLAGFSFGFCFGVYRPGQVMPGVLFVLLLVLWWREAGARKAISWALPVMLLGFLVALAPLILWVARDFTTAKNIYFSPLSAGFAAGEGVTQAQSLMDKLNGSFSRILPEMPKVASMYTTKATLRPWYLIPGAPVIDRATLVFFFFGFAICLARFKKAGYAMLVAMWFFGLVPTLLSNPLLNMDERRIMLSLPATLMMAGLGLWTALDLATRILRPPLANRAALGLALAFFALFGWSNWRSYFHVFNRDQLHLEYNHANFDNITRAVFKENNKAPIYLISFRKQNIDSWEGPNGENELDEHMSVLRPIPMVICSGWASYFENNGLYGALRARPSAGPDQPAPDPLVLLTAFHYYLEPWLVKEFGGERVQEVVPTRTSTGLSLRDLGMVTDRTSAARLIRLKNFDPGKLEGMKQRWLFPYTVEELTPPKGLPTRDELRPIWIYNKIIVDALQNYDKNPKAWKATRSASFSQPDLYFWVTANNFPSNIQMPLRLRGAWSIEIPADGEYAFGASSTMYASIKIDGKKVYTHLPTAKTDEEPARDGTLGAPVFLAKGMHSFEVEQVMLSAAPMFNHLIRLVWQRPGSAKETLPMEFLVPPAPPAQAAK